MMCNVGQIYVLKYKNVCAKEKIKRVVKYLQFCTYFIIGHVYVKIRIISTN